MRDRNGRVVSLLRVKEELKMSIRPTDDLRPPYPAPKKPKVIEIRVPMSFGIIVGAVVTKMVLRILINNADAIQNFLISIFAL